MKKVYIGAVNTCGKKIAEEVVTTTISPNTRTVQLRVSIAVILGILFIFNTNTVRAQNCPGPATPLHSQNSNENTYWPATASAAAGATSITLGTAGYGSAPIAVGDIVLVIQMQGAKINIPAIGSGLYGGNNSGKGSGFLSTNMVAGTMEYAVAASAVPLGGGGLTLSAGLNYSYVNSAFGTDGQYTYQVIRVPSYYNIQFTGTVNTPLWNGSTGGVTVINAINQLDFNSRTISAQGAGFRGGGGVKKNGAAGTLNTDYYTTSGTNANGSKGEGIAGTPKYVNNNFVLQTNATEGYPSGSFARGAPGNAGGGATDSRPTANDQNAGGGGGGNGGSGGWGGNGWSSFLVTGGFGGSPYRTVSPSTVIYYNSPRMMIMGGGGGAGDTNDGTGTLGALSSSGASGGGIVLISATSIMGNGTINVNGDTFDRTVLNDATGGGGAGGSVLVYAASGQSGITVLANGGNGISNYPGSAGATQHGPGGGGGGGVVNSNLPFNAASSVTGGIAGVSIGTNASDNFNAQNGFAGFINSTVTFAQIPPKMQICQITILPVTILSFNASYESANNVKVAWTTTDEINASYFEVERSTDGVSFITVAEVNASESGNPIHSYFINDQLTNINTSVVYYRLRIVDKDGKFAYSKIIPVKLEQPENVISVYPNPVDNYVILNLYAAKPSNGSLRLIDNSGKQILTKSFNVQNGNNSVLIDKMGYLPKGVYVIQVLINNNLYNQKVIKK